MKRILPILILSFCFLTGCEFGQSSEAPEPTVPPVLVVDVAAVFRDSQPGKDGLAFLEEIQARMQAELVILQGQMEADPENTELQSMAQAIYLEFQQAIALEEQNVVTILQTLLQEKLVEYRTEKGVPLIIGSDTTLAYDATLDVTADLIAKMNEEDVTYTSALAPAPVEEEASEEIEDETTEEAEEVTEEESAEESEEVTEEVTEEDTE